MSRGAERTIVLELLRQGNNAKTIKRIKENYPDLGEDRYKSLWKDIVSDVTGVSKEDLKLSAYPSKGKITNELKVSLSSWAKGGLPFTLMLYEYENAGVHLLLHKDDYDSHEDALRDFAKCNAGVVGDYPKVPYWTTWRSVLEGHGTATYPEETLIKNETYFFQDEFWKQVEKKLKDHLVQNGLLDQINKWLAHHPA